MWDYFVSARDNFRLASHAMQDDTPSAALSSPPFSHPGPPLWHTHTHTNLLPRLSTVRIPSPPPHACRPRGLSQDSTVWTAAFWILFVIFVDVKVTSVPVGRSLLYFVPNCSTWNYRRSFVQEHLEPEGEEEKILCCQTTFECRTKNQLKWYHKLKKHTISC